MVVVLYKLLRDKEKYYKLFNDVGKFAIYPKEILVGFDGEEDDENKSQKWSEMRYHRYGTRNNFPNQKNYY